jgi:hypothetical protein
MGTETHSDIADPQSYWLDHIQRCGDRQSLAEYAKTNNLRVNKLYYWKKRLKRLGLLPADQHAVSFTTVQVTQPAVSMPACRLSFPNGMIMEWEMLSGSVELGSVLSTVHRLP